MCLVSETLIDLNLLNFWILQIKRNKMKKPISAEQARQINRYVSFG
jgi:hypothetical protein